MIGAYRISRVMLAGVVGLASCAPAIVHARGKDIRGFSVRWNGSELLPPGIRHAPASAEEFSKTFVEAWSADEELVLLVMGKERVVRTCRDLIGLEGEVGQTKPADDWERFVVLRVECGTVKRMVRMRPGLRANVSFAVMPLVRELGRLHVPGRPGALAGLLRAKSVECEAATSCNVSSDEEDFDVEAVAYGDYNGDGVMDLVLHIGAGQRIGAGSVWFGMIVTRYNKNGPLIVLDSW